MMKRLLTIGLLLLATEAFADSPRGKGCRVLIGEDWIAMGATSIPSCLKYAEAAASPGERQFAEFGATKLAYQDGQYFQSTDGGGNWQRFYPQQGNGVISSLNVLRMGPAETQPDKKAEKSKQKVDTAVAAAVEAPASAAPVEVPPKRAKKSAPAPTIAAVIIPPADTGASALATDTAAAELEQSAPVPTITSPAAKPVAAGPSRAQEEYATSSGQSGPLGCQLHVGNKWQVTPTSSLTDCGRLLAGMTGKAGAPSGQAYWAGNYLFFSKQQLFQSADGQSWKRIR